MGAGAPPPPTICPSDNTISHEPAHDGCIAFTNSSFATVAPQRHDPGEFAQDAASDEPVGGELGAADTQQRQDAGRSNKLRL